MIPTTTMCPQEGIADIQHSIITKSTFEISCTVGTQPKFALVDTFSHASCKNRRNVGKQNTFPTTWREAERIKLRGSMVGCQRVQILSMYLFPQVPKGMMTSGKLAYSPHESE
jgi:hypothetical protein